MALPLTLILTHASDSSPALNHHPSYSYLLQAAEQWLASTPAREVTLIIETDDSQLIHTVSDYTKLPVSDKREKRKPHGIAIVLDSRYPLLSHSLWNRLADSKNEIRVLNHRRKEIAYSRFLTSDREDKPASTLSPEIVVAEDPLSGLDVTDPVQRVMAEAAIRAGFYPVHPVRYRPPYKVETPQAGSGSASKMALLFSAPSHFFSPELRRLWEEHFEITWAWNAPESVTRDLLQGKQVWVTATCPSYRISRSLMEASDQLRLIATPSTGTNHIDLEDAHSLGIPVCSIKTSVFLKEIHSSSEHTFALLLAMVRKLTLVSREAAYGHWREREEEFRTIELNGRTIGILGYGRIGGNLSRWSHAFGMKVLAFDPLKKIEDPWVEQLDSRETLLERSDIVSVNYHLTPETAGSFGRAEFDRMREGAFFLNTARGEIVDEQAMIDALRSGRLKAAAVDVISQEEELSKWNHPVIAFARECDRLIVTPHTAGLTVDSESKAALEILNEIKQQLHLL